MTDTEKTLEEQEDREASDVQLLEPDVTGYDAAVRENEIVPEEELALGLSPESVKKRRKYTRLADDYLSQSLPVQFLGGMAAGVGYAAAVVAGWEPGMAEGAGLMGLATTTNISVKANCRLGKKIAEYSDRLGATTVLDSNKTEEFTSVLSQSPAARVTYPDGSSDDKEVLDVDAVYEEALEEGEIFPVLTVEPCGGEHFNVWRYEMRLLVNPYDDELGQLTGEPETQEFVREYVFTALDDDPETAAYWEEQGTPIAEVWEEYEAVQEM